MYFACIARAGLLVYIRRDVSTLCRPSITVKSCFSSLEYGLACNLAFSGLIQPSTREPKLTTSPLSPL